MTTTATSMARITAIGTYVPERILSNEDLERLVETNDEWIVQRTGMKERRIAADDEFVSDLCYAAVEDLIRRFGKSVEDVDHIIVSTTTADYAFPSVACMIQQRFGIRKAGAIDLAATCAGFTYALHMANALVSSGMHRKVLVVASETLSKVTDYTDRSTCILFGDGAGAVLVERDDSRPGFFGYDVDSNGAGGAHVYRTGLSTEVLGNETAGSGKIVQNGREVYKWAVSTVPKAMVRLAEQAGTTLDAVDWFVPHSANMRMIESICEKSGFPVEKTLTSMEYFGNTSAATIPLAIDLALKSGKLRDGDRMLLYGFGGGLVQAGLLVEWSAFPSA